MIGTVEGCDKELAMGSGKNSNIRAVTLLTVVENHEPMLHPAQKLHADIDSLGFAMAVQPHGEEMAGVLSSQNG